MAYATSGYDGSMMNSLQTVLRHYFNRPRGALLGVLSAIMALGSISSSPLAPLVADKFGRRWGITVGSIIIIVDAIIQCESRNFTMFLISRFILGYGLTFARPQRRPWLPSCAFPRSARRLPPSTTHGCSLGALLPHG
ncbi:major facilitator superfamily domain-containing protein [Lipomyces starkeyi]